MSTQDRHEEFAETIQRVSDLFSKDEKHDKLWWAAVLRRAANILHPQAHGPYRSGPSRFRIDIQRRRRK